MNHPFPKQRFQNEEKWAKPAPQISQQRQQFFPRKINLLVRHDGEPGEELSSIFHHDQSPINGPPVPPVPELNSRKQQKNLSARIKKLGNNESTRTYPPRTEESSEARKDGAESDTLISHGCVRFRGWGRASGSWIGKYVGPRVTGKRERKAYALTRGR